MKSFESLEKVFECLWKFLKVSEILWNSLKFSEIILKVSVSLWKFLKVFESLWKSLKVSESLWKSLKVSESLLKVSESLLMNITVMHSKRVLSLVLRKKLTKSICTILHTKTVPFWTSEASEKTERTLSLAHAYLNT